MMLGFVQITDISYRRNCGWGRQSHAELIGRSIYLFLFNLYFTRKIPLRLRIYFSRETWTFNRWQQKWMSSVVLLQNNILPGTGGHTLSAPTCSTLSLTPVTKAGEFMLPHHINCSRTSEGIWQWLWGWSEEGGQNQLCLIYTRCMHLMNNTFRVEWWHNWSFSFLVLSGLGYWLCLGLFSSQCCTFTHSPSRIPSDKYSNRKSLY